MVSLSGSTVAWKMLYAPAALPPTGYHIYPGFFSASAPQIWRTQTSLQQKGCMIHRLYFLVSSCPHQNVRWIIFFTEFHNHLTKLTQIPTRHNVSVTSASTSQLPNQLLQASFVLVRRDNHISPLDTRYEGPYKVVKRSLHTFQL